MQVVGPGLGGLLAQLVSAAAGLVLDAVSFLVSAACLARIRPENPTPPRKPVESLGRQIRVGIDFLRRTGTCPGTSLLGSVSNFGLIGYSAILVLHLVRDLGLSPTGVGVVLALGSAGGLVGAAIAPYASRRLGSGRATTLLMLLGGPPALLVALGEPGWRTGLVPLGLFVVGVFVVAGNVIRGAWRQRYVPAELLARVVTTSQVIAYSRHAAGRADRRLARDDDRDPLDDRGDGGGARAGQRGHPGQPVPRAARPTRSTRTSRSQAAASESWSAGSRRCSGTGTGRRSRQYGARPRSASVAQ